jgi:hypothetical protein
VYRNIILSFANLKITAFILSIIVLVLSCMPCTDGGNSMGKAKQEVVKSSHQQDYPKTDACSPFCSCSCCSGVPIPKVLAKLVLAKVEFKKQYYTFYSSSVKDVSLAIWQPPQLV